MSNPTSRSGVDRARRAASPLTSEILAACKRAARALTAYLSVCAEKPLTHAQINLIRALRFAEISAEKPLYDPAKLMGMVAHFFSPNQLEFAAELLAECLAGADGEGDAILAELDVVAQEQLDAAGPAGPDAA